MPELTFDAVVPEILATVEGLKFPPDFDDYDLAYVVIEDYLLHYLVSDRASRDDIEAGYTLMRRMSRSEDENVRATLDVGIIEWFEHRLERGEPGLAGLVTGAPEPLDAALRRMFPGRWDRLRFRLGVPRAAAAPSRVAVFETSCLALEYDGTHFQEDVRLILAEEPSRTIDRLFPVGLKWLAVGVAVLDSFELVIEGPEGEHYLPGIQFGAELERLLERLDATGSGWCGYSEGGRIRARLDGETMTLFLNSDFHFGWTSYASFRADVLSGLYQIAAFFEERDARCLHIQNDIGGTLRRWRTFRA